MPRHAALSGLIFVAIGAAFATYAFLGLEIGTAFRMGPGYFPLVLGLVLIGVGAAQALRADDPNAGANRPIPWRGLALVLAAPLLFAVTVRWLGLIPAVALTVLVSSFATPAMRFRAALALTVALTVFCVLVFHTGLGLPIPLLGRWL